MNKAAAEAGECSSTKKKLTKNETALRPSQQHATKRQGQEQEPPPPPPTPAAATT